MFVYFELLITLLNPTIYLIRQLPLEKYFFKQIVTAVLYYPYFYNCVFVISEVINLRSMLELESEGSSTQEMQQQKEIIIHRDKTIENLQVGI
jgi:hypothetical protein